MSEAIIRTLIICLFVLAVIVLFFFGASKGWMKNLKVSKTGLEIEGVIKQKQSGGLNRMLDKQLHDLDTQVEVFAIKTANELYQSLIRQLKVVLPHLGARVVADTIRRILVSYHGSQFKILLRPENFKGFIDGVMRDIRIEYISDTMDQKNCLCPLHEGGCFTYPAFHEIESIARERILHNWAFPLRQFQINTHEKKIDLYKQFILSYGELEDFVRADIAKERLEKNKEYIEALSRKPEGHEL